MSFTFKFKADDLSLLKNTDIQCSLEVSAEQSTELETQWFEENFAI